MKILVTGGAGFIGSHLVEELLSNENEILIFDNCLTGKKENLDIKGNFKFELLVIIFINSFNLFFATPYGDSGSSA